MVSNKCLSPGICTGGDVSGLGEAATGRPVILASLSSGLIIFRLRLSSLRAASCRSLSSSVTASEAVSVEPSAVTLVFSAAAVLPSLLSAIFGGRDTGIEKSITKYQSLAGNK